MRATIPFALLLLLSLPAAAECLPFDQALEHIGETKCVTGTVVKVDQSRGGSFFLDFCEKYASCPFTVVVFPANLRDVGDVRRLEGKVIEIHGPIKHWNGRAEIILKDIRQLKGGMAMIPPMPKGFDVERHGNFSAGQVSRSKTPTPSASTKKTPTAPADLMVTPEKQ